VMAAVLTEKSTIKCAHQGTVKPIASQTKLKVAGNKVLVMGDLSGKPISGCSTPQTPPPPGPPNKPCMTVSSEIPGIAMKLKVSGKNVLLPNVQGFTDGVLSGAAPQTWSVQDAGQTKLKSA